FSSLYTTIQLYCFESMESLMARLSESSSVDRVYRQSLTHVSFSSSPQYNADLRPQAPSGCHCLDLIEVVAHRSSIEATRRHLPHKRRYSGDLGTGKAWNLIRLGSSCPCPVGQLRLRRIWLAIRTPDLLPAGVCPISHG